MKLTVFNSFFNPKILDDIHHSIPQLKIDYPTTSDNVSKRCLSICKTNAKLFYTKDETDALDDILAQLEQHGFVVTDRRPSYQKRITITERTTLDIKQISCTKCGTLVDEVQYDGKVITEEVTCYLDDRVILEWKL